MVLAAAAGSGCAPWLERPFAALRDGGDEPRTFHPRGPTPPFDTPPPCRAGRLPAGAESEPDLAVSVGPVLFAGLRRARSLPAGDAFITVPAILPPGTRATILIGLDDRDAAGIASGPPGPLLPEQARRAVVCATGPSPRTFSVTFAVATPRCVPIVVVSGGRSTTRRVAFGQRRCR